MTTSSRPEDMAWPECTADSRTMPLMVARKRGRWLWMDATRMRCLVAWLASVNAVGCSFFFQALFFIMSTNAQRTRVMEDFHLLVDRVELDGKVDVAVADAKLGHPGVMLHAAVERVEKAVDLVLRVGDEGVGGVDLADKVKQGVVKAAKVGVCYENGCVVCNGGVQNDIPPMTMPPPGLVCEQ